MNLEPYDAIISGCGPAGCAAAIVLSRADRRVLVLDKATFPRDKVCGDGITGGALQVLQQLGVLDHLGEQAHQLIRRVRIVSPSGHEMLADLKPTAPGVDAAWGMPRRDFDTALASYVKALPGVTVQEKMPVTGLWYDDRGEAGGVRAGGGDQATIFRAPVIIGADGVHSKVAAQAGLANKVPRHRAFAVRAYYDNVQGLADTVAVYYDDTVAPGYGWLIPNGPHSVNVGVGIYQRFESEKKVRGIFDNFVGHNPGVARYLKDARLVPQSLRGWPLLTGTYPGARSRGNVLLCGDAGSFVEPVGGEGVYFALQSGLLAARAARDGLERGDPRLAGKIYERAWRQALKWREYVPGRIIQSCMSRRFLLDRSIRMMSRKPARAELFAQAVSHNISKAKLIRLFFG